MSLEKELQAIFEEDVLKPNKHIDPVIEIPVKKKMKFKLKKKVSLTEAEDLIIQGIANKRFVKPIMEEPEQLEEEPEENEQENAPTEQLTEREAAELRDCVTGYFKTKKGNSNPSPGERNSFIRRLRIKLGSIHSVIKKLRPFDVRRQRNTEESVDDDVLKQAYSEAINPHKRSRNVRRKRKIQKKRAHRGTNWNTLKPKKGFKRVKVNGKYVRVKMGSKEKISRSRVGRAVGRKSGKF